jgi:hypothetical protein
MGLSVNKSRTDAVGRYTKLVTGTITFDSSYVTNGEPLVSTDVGLSSKIEVICCAPASGYVFEYDYDNNKLKAFNTTKGGVIPAGGAPGVEVASTTDLSSVTCRFIAFGN